MAVKRSRILVAVAAVAVIGGIVAFDVIKDRRMRVDVRTEKVGRRDLTATVSASGEIRPKRFVDISSNVSGRITHMQVREGDAVERGQVLARIDSTRFEADVQQGEAALGARRADLERAIADLEVEKLSFERAKSTHAQQLISDEVFDQASARVRMRTAAAESMRLQIAQQEAFLTSSRDNLEKTTVIAPMAGVITNLAKEEGEMVIGAQSFQPTVIMTVADLSVMECEIMVDETDIRSVALGQVGLIEVDAFRDLGIEGHVTEIGSSAIPRGAGTAGAVSSGGTASNQAKDVKVVITLTDPPDVLRPGLNATADITTGEAKGALALPIQAIVVRPIDEDGKVIDPEGGDDEEAALARATADEVEGVFVVNDKQAHFQRVETGLMGETHLEITEGLEEGAVVVIGSYKTLRTLKDEAQVKTEKAEEEVSAEALPATPGREAAAEPLIHIEDLWRSYDMGARRRRRGRRRGCGRRCVLHGPPVQAPGSPSAPTRGGSALAVRGESAL